MVIGSGTNKKMCETKTPVLVIKEKPITKKLGKVVYSSDFSNKDVADYLAAKTFFKNLDCNLQLVYVSTNTTKSETNEALEIKMKNFFKKINEDVTNIKDVKVIRDHTVKKGVLYLRDNKNSEVLKTYAW